MSKFSSPRIAGAEVLQVRMAIYVPSTIYDKKIPQEQFKNRVNQTVKFLNMFGGTTKYRETGSWIDDNKTINEKIVVVESFAKIKDYNKAKKQIVKWLKSKRKSWKQKKLSFEFEDDLILVN